MWSAIVEVMPEFFIVTIAVYTLFYLYIRERYDTLYARKAADVFKKEDNVATIVWGVGLGAALVTLLVIRHLIEPTNATYYVVLIVITLVIVAIEGSVFKVIAPRLL